MIESENGFQGWLLGLAALLGWRCAHFRPAMTKSGRWVTPVAADGKGFPDICAVHRVHGLIFAELKSERGRVGAEQAVWIDALTAAGARIFVWRPSDRREIEDVLRGCR